MNMFLLIIGYILLCCIVLGFLHLGKVADEKRLDALRRDKENEANDASV